MSGNRLTDRLLRRGESSKVAFQASADSREVIAQTVCAFLNTKGGVVVVGVDDDGHPNGTANATRTDRLRDFLHETITPHVLFTVSLDDTSMGPVISVDVPAGPDRPYVFQGAAHVRRGSSTRPANAEQLRALVTESTGKSDRWERRPSSGLELADLDGKLIDETVRRAQDRRGYNFENPKNRGAVLGDLALMRFGQLTHAADVLFGKRIALRHPQTRLRAVCYASDRADDFLDEHLFEGPAFVLLENAMAFLKRNVAIGSEFREGKLARDSRPEYPFNSLREGLVNALVHRDYASFSGSVSVNIYPDRVELWNTGRLPKGLTPRDLQLPSHDSILVNPDIGHVFYLHELMERVGRGTYKIVQECRDMGMRLPEWKNIRSGVRLTLFARRPNQPVTTELNDRQQALLKSLAAGEQIQLREYVERFGGGVSDRQARRDLSDLEAYGLLDRYGAGPATRYERTDRSP